MTNLPTPPDPNDIQAMEKWAEAVITIGIHSSVANAEHVKLAMQLAKQPIKPSLKVSLLNLANKYYIDMMKLKADIECHKEQNLRAMGLNSASSPTINIMNLPDSVLDKYLNQGDKKVDALFQVDPDTGDTVESSLSLSKAIEQDNRDCSQVYDKLYVGDKFSSHDKPGWGIVSACKTFHKKKLAYTNTLAASHPNYLHYLEGDHLYLNMIDPDAPLFKVELFTIANRFIAQQLQKGHEVLIHCDKGESRGPTVALVFLAKVGVIANKDYSTAAQEFCQRYKNYKPGKGIRTFLSDSVNWKEIMK